RRAEGIRPRPGCALTFAEGRGERLVSAARNDAGPLAAKLNGRASEEREWGPMARNRHRQGICARFAAGAVALVAVMGATTAGAAAATGDGDDVQVEVEITPTDEASPTEEPTATE